MGIFISYGAYVDAKGFQEKRVMGTMNNVTMASRFNKDILDILSSHYLWKNLHFYFKEMIVLNTS